MPLHISLKRKLLPHVDQTHKVLEAMLPNQAAVLLIDDHGVVFEFDWAAYQLNAPAREVLKRERFFWEDRHNMNCIFTENDLVFYSEHIRQKDDYETREPIAVLVLALKGEIDETKRVEAYKALRLAAGVAEALT
jgi:hypothetical protein